MSVSDNSKYTFRTLPIKKRPVTLVQSSSPPLQDCERPESKPFITGLHSSASTRGIQSSGVTIKGYCLQHKIEPKEEFIANSDLDKVTRCASFLGSDGSGVFGLLFVAKSASEDSTLDRKPVFQPLMESAKVLSPSTCSARLQKGVFHNDRPAHEKVSVSAALQFPSKSVLGLSSPGQNTEAADPGSDSGTEEFQAPLGIGRMNLDLNFQMEAWDDSSDSFTKKQGDGGWIETGGLQLPSSEIATASIGRDATLGKCTLQKSTCNFGLGDLSSAPNGQNDLGVSLDLQLKPPSKQQPTFNWSEVVLGQKESDAEGIDLSLSMVGSRMKPEPCDADIQGYKEVEFDLQNSTSAIHVKSEPYQEDGTSKTTATHKSVSDSFVSTKRAPPGDPKGGGEDSPASMGSDRMIKSVMGSDRMIKSVMGMPQNLCVRDFYNKFDNPHGSKVRNFYNNKFEIDLNSLPVDSDDDSSMPSEANEISARVAGKSASHDQSTDSSEAGGHGKIAESSSLLEDENGIVDKSSTLVPEPMEIEQKELNSAKEVSGADGLDPGVSQRSKPAAPDTSHDSDSKMVSVDCNDPIASKVISAEVHMEVNGKSEAADSDEGSEEFEEVPEEVSSEESEEFEEVEVSCDNESEECEEIIEEVSCNKELDDSSHHDEGAGNTKPKADSPHDEHGAREVRGVREESALHGKDTTNSVPATSPAIMSSEEDVTGSQNPDDDIKGELEVIVPENPHPSALGAPPATSKKRPFNATDLGLNNNIVEATEDGNMKQGRGTWKMKSGRRKEKGWGEPGKNFAEATNVGSMKNGWGSWRTKSGLNKDTDEATKVGSTKNGWEPWEAKSGINKDTAEPSEKGRYVSRQGNARKMHSDASKREGSWERSGVTSFKTGPKRSSYGKREPRHPRSSPSQRDGFSGKPFRHDKPQPRWHRDDRRSNQKNCRFENNRNQANQFGMRRSDYTWQRQSDDASKFPRTENAWECVGSPSSQRPVRDANQIVRSVSPSGSYIGRDIGRDISDLQLPQPAHEGRVITRDLPGSSVNHPRFSCPSPTPQYVQAEDVLGKRSGSPSFMPSPTPLEHPPELRLRSPPVSEQNELPSSRQHAYYYPQNTVAPRHDSKPADGVREMSNSTRQYLMSSTSLQRNTSQRRLDNDPQQAQEVSFRCVEYNHGGRQAAEAGCFGERHNGARNGPRPRPTPFASVVYKNIDERDGNFQGQLRDIKQKMWDIDHQQSQGASFRHERYDHDGEQRVHAGPFDQRRNNGVPNGPRDVAYGSIHERLNGVPNDPAPALVHGHYGERGGMSNGNVFDRLGDTPTQTEDAELCYERNFGVESGPRPAPSGARVHNHFQQRGNLREYGGNFRKQFGGNNPNGARGVGEQTENYSFHGRRRWRDTKFSDAGLKRRKY